MIGQPLLFQGALIRPQFLIQFLAPPRDGFSEPLPSVSGLGLSFLRALCPLPESSETLFQVRSSFRSLRILYRDLGKPVVGVQSQRTKIVFDDICLGRPAMNIGLGKLDGIDRWGFLCGHDRDQFRRRLFGWGGGGLPSFAPPGPLFKGQVTVPTRRVRCFLWIRLNRNCPAQVTDECYRAGHSGSSGWSSRGKLMRARATSRMSCPWVFLLKGTKARTPENEERSRDFLVCKIVTTWRPCTCNLARNAVAMPSRSTIIRVRLSVSRVLFIPFQKYGDAHGEMLVSAMGGNAQGMAVLVVQQQERAAPQNDAQTPDQSAREKHVTVDGLTMPIDRSRVSVWGWAVSSARACGGCQSWVLQHARADVKLSAPSA